MSLYSNIVEKDTVRKVQGDVLDLISKSLVNSFGPYGSNTLIYNDTTQNKYTKDGHDIVKGIKIMFPIEASVQRDLLEITYNTVKEVGDGTTSAVIASAEIFKALKELEDEFTPYDLMRKFKNTVDYVSNEILIHKQDFTSDMAYRISMISTNGNEEISSQIKDIYEKYGNDVYITINVTNRDRNVLKVYDGLTMKEGVYSSAYMNLPEENKAQLRDAHIYYFDDPIDTPSMISLFDSIVKHNIFNGGKAPIVPTVILTPFISRDMSSYIEGIENAMNSAKGINKPPLIIINNIFKNGNVDDIVKMCGCKPIKKYIDPQQQKKDIELGLAPNMDNVHEFCGHAEMVVSTTTDTKFINPDVMVKRDEDGVIVGYSDEYNSLIEFLENEIHKVLDENFDDNTVGKLKSRLHNLKANMVEFVIGGISVSDREALKALVEDAVLNCRSAAEHGVGYGANFEALRATDKILKKDLTETNLKFVTIINKAYREIQKTLFKTMKISDEEVDKIIDEELATGKAYNMIEKKCDGNVLSSIMTDVVVLDSISKLLTLLFTCNQFLVEKPQENVYGNKEMYKEK